jgi:uncharacterized protein YqjF (DUF2071 family)
MKDVLQARMDRASDDKRMPSPFLTAEWRHLAILNFVINPSALHPYVPAGTELDLWNGRTLVSLVGFMFLNTRVRGVPIPFHRNFEEVNLRFYVRRRTHEGWRRGVVFIKELVPRTAVAVAARLVYGENYSAVPMSHRIEASTAGERPLRRVSYRWRFKATAYEIEVTAGGESRQISAGSEEAFVTEHYWGYGRRRKHTLEYQVLHPQWRVWPAQTAAFRGDVSLLYGGQFVECLSAAPRSALLAEGSSVTVLGATPLPYL